LEEENTRQAEIHHLKLEREAEIHAATIAKLNTATEGQGQDEALDNGRSIILPPAAKDIELSIPGLHKKDMEAIMNGSFEPENLSRLRTHARRQYRGNVTTIEDGHLQTSKPKADLKPLHTPEIYFECLTNYIIIVSALCQCPPGLNIALLQFMNRIRTLSTFYVWKGGVLDLALNYHGWVMSHGQLEPSHWTIPDSFERPFTTPFLMLDHFSARGAANKRNRADTRTSPSAALNTCYNWNKAARCLKDPCKYDHRCSKCGEKHRAQDCK
jgi:hypothetical protein